MTAPPPTYTEDDLALAVGLMQTHLARLESDLRRAHNYVHPEASENAPSKVEVRRLEAEVDKYAGALQRLTGLVKE